MFLMAIWLSGTEANADVDYLGRTIASDLKFYSAEQGLSSVSGVCLLRSPAGYILVCSEHGIYQYDGRRFVNLGVAQGLRQGGVIHGMEMTHSGQLAIYYTNEVYVSDRPADQLHPWDTVHFSAVRHPDIKFFDDKPHSLVNWRNDLIFATRDGLWKINLPVGQPPFLTSMPYSEEEKALLEHPIGIYNVADKLWSSLEDGRLCQADPGSVTCFGAVSGLPNEQWTDIIADSDGTVLARSATMLASLDHQGKFWKSIILPDQKDGRYSNFQFALRMFRAPDGRILTQSDHGLLTHDLMGWRLLPSSNGFGRATVTDAMSGMNGDFWFSSEGDGIIRWIGYGRWENIDQTNGLSGGIPWQTSRSADGHVWVATDTGLDKIVHHDQTVAVNQVVPGSSYVLVTAPDGKLWNSDRLDGVRVIDPSTERVDHITSPPVNAIVPGKVFGAWIGTENGLYHVTSLREISNKAVFIGVDHHQITVMQSDRNGGVFYSDEFSLRHHYENGRDVLVEGYHQAATFRPFASAFDNVGGLWIGGEGGLYRLLVNDDKVVESTLMETSDTRTNTIVALLVDHRGWIWAGTPLGLSVFDGSRWISIDASIGLASNDINQGGLREDPDGSVWIATSLGLSHLLRTDDLFADPHIKVVISQALVGGQPVSEHLPYSQKPLELLFGTTSYARERSIVFRYRLSGVDADWATTASGVVRYPFVPPGRHVLEVVGYDELSRRSSPPVMLPIGMAYPWWRQGWFVLACVVAVLLALYGTMRFRLRLVLARQARLRRAVAEATAELRASQEQLRFQATHDELTGLYTRREIERRLAVRLEGRGHDRDLVVALMDVDHFKAINDGFGHLGGDDVLRSVGSLVRGQINADDEAGRYGGEEILVLLDDANGGGAERVLTLHRLIRGTSFTAAGRSLRATCSIGVAWARRGDDWETLIGRADRA
ncbi:MAG: diguanylate cyclase, partial [Terriglobus roseus]|nr:diguanylate cyclase [Terriglobus roseus]